MIFGDVILDDIEQGLIFVPKKNIYAFDFLDLPRPEPAKKLHQPVFFRKGECLDLPRGAHAEQVAVRLVAVQCAEETRALRPRKWADGEG